MGETALHIAAEKGDITTITVLLKYNPKLDVPDMVRLAQTTTLPYSLLTLIGGVHTYIESRKSWSS